MPPVVEIYTKAERELVLREGSGSSPGKVRDVALKAAETDATKRVLATFGNPSAATMR